MSEFCGQIRLGNIVRELNKFFTSGHLKVFNVVIDILTIPERGSLQHSTNSLDHGAVLKRSTLREEDCTPY